MWRSDFKGSNSFRPRIVRPLCLLKRPGLSATRGAHQPDPAGLPGNLRADSGAADPAAVAVVDLDVDC